MTTPGVWPLWVKAWLVVVAMAIANGAVRNVVTQPLFTAVAPALARNLRLRAARPSRSTSVGPST